MPVVKIHIPSTVLPFERPILVKEARNVLVEVLKIDEYAGQVLMYETLPQWRSISSQRNIDFVCVEIYMKPGRTQEMKQELMNKLKELINKHTGAKIEDIICFIVEPPAENWG